LSAQTAQGLFALKIHSDRPQRHLMEKNKVGKRLRHSRLAFT
jgi:hypothetical protein